MKTQPFEDVSPIKKWWCSIVMLVFRAEFAAKFAGQFFIQPLIWKSAKPVSFKEGTRVSMEVIVTIVVVSWFIAPIYGRYPTYYIIGVIHGYI